MPQPARTDRPGRAVSTIPAATVSCVRSSIRMNAPVVRFAAYGSATTGALVLSRIRPMSLSSSEAACVVAAVKRVRNRIFTERRQRFGTPGEWAG